MNERIESSMKRLIDKVAVITGAGRGIDRAVADAFAREGASIVLADVDRKSGADAEKAIRKSGGTAVFCNNASIFLRDRTDP